MQLSEKIVPHFRYRFYVSTSDQLSSLRTIRDRLLRQGGVLKGDSNSKIQIEISASKLATTVNFFPNFLTIIVTAKGISELEIEVVRTSERTAGLSFVAFSTLMCTISFWQNRSPQVFVIPIIFYGLFWIHSILPVHPAHKQLRKILLFADE